MKIYTFRSQPGQAYLIDAADNRDCCEPDPPRALRRTWIPPQFEIVLSDEFEHRRPKCDFPGYLPIAIMLSEKAAVRLTPVLSECGEILPIRVINDLDSYFFSNVTRIINSVDMRRSKFLKLPSGAIGPCEKLVFDPSRIPEDALFFRSTQMGPVSEVFGTERAVNAVRDANLTGHDFRLVWSDE